MSIVWYSTVSSKRGSSVRLDERWVCRVNVVGYFRLKCVLFYSYILNTLNWGLAVVAESYQKVRNSFSLWYVYLNEMNWLFTTVLYTAVMEDHESFCPNGIERISIVWNLWILDFNSTFWYLIFSIDNTIYCSISKCTSKQNIKILQKRQK